VSGLVSASVTGLSQNHKKPRQPEPEGANFKVDDRMIRGGSMRIKPLYTYPLQFNGGPMSYGVVAKAISTQ
jgi:hypothetical protein